MKFGAELLLDTADRCRGELRGAEEDNGAHCGSKILGAELLFDITDDRDREELRGAEEDKREHCVSEILSAELLFDITDDRDGEELRGAEADKGENCGSETLDYSENEGKIHVRNIDAATFFF